ncbi:MAG: hypothetical protein CMK09_03465 [Ponticaulis sp.]|nr:hypothetical protein [Ponticaulis sp.]|tara:strand:- start:7134 stop:7928 length:795 start_codon:yes stop_codon:yes gene_type:complete
MTISHLGFFVSAFALVSLTGCDQPQEVDTPVEATETAAPAASPCADEGPVFPITGKCVGRAINFIDGPAMPDHPDMAYFEQMTGDTCEWKLMEMAFATDALFYQGIVCGDRETTLEFAGGAQSAEISLASSAYRAETGFSETPLVRVFSADPEDRFANVLFRAREAMEDPDAASECSVVGPDVPGWPEDALVVDNPVEAEAYDPADGPRSACGPLGLNQGETNFWRVFGGFSWFFMLGQEPVGIAPGSFTLMTQDEDGEWVRAE